MPTSTYFTGPIEKRMSDDLRDALARSRFVVASDPETAGPFESNDHSVQSMRQRHGANEAKCFIARR